MFFSKSAAIFAAAAAFTTAALGATFVVPSDRDMVRRSDAIVVGAALNSYSQLADNGAIETVTVLSIEEVIKGRITSAVLPIHEAGGTVGDKTRYIAGVPKFADGERVVLFLSEHERRWGVTDIALGKYSFATDLNGQKLLVRDENEIIGWNPDGTGHREMRRSAEKFLQYLREVARGGDPKADYILPSYPLLKAQSIGHPLKPVPLFTPNSYASDCGSGFGCRWFTFPSSVTILTASGAGATAISAVNAAIGAWDGDCGSNVNYVNGGSAACSDATCTGLLGMPPDSQNTVLFERNLTSIGISAFSCTMGGVLGIGGSSVATGPQVGPSGTWWSNQEVDVEMNQGVLGCATFISSGDLPTAVTHEVGHTLGFRHSDQTRANDPMVACSTDPTLECSSGAIMRSFIPHGLNATLTSYDIDAVRGIYPSPCNATKRGDITGDGKADVVWRRDVTGENYLWTMNGTILTAATPLPQLADTNWKIVGQGDFDNDGKSDLLWRNMSTGANYIWFMNGSTLLSAQPILTVADQNFQVAAVGDFSGDGKADIFWRNSLTGANYVWVMNGSTIMVNQPVTTVADLNWQVVGTGDFDGDGKYDVLWRNTSTGGNYLWIMNGAAVASQSAVTAVTDGNFFVVAVGDFTGDGKADIFWRNILTGANYLWQMNGAALTTSTAVVAVTDVNWKVVGFGDFNNDNKTDLFWRHAVTGDTYVWLMSGATLQTNAGVSTVSDPNWKVVAPK